MFDLHVLLPDELGALARLGKALGAAGVSLEGGGVFVVEGVGHAHFLVADGETGRQAVEAVAVREVLVRRLDQERPGELGRIAGTLGEAGVNILTQYSDHANRLILVVDDPEKAAAVTTEWTP